MPMKRLPATLTLSALLFAAPAAMAQSAGQGYNPPPPQSAPAQVDDATIDKFADAYADVQSIQQDFSQQLQGVESDEQARVLQMKAQEQMISAVEGAGLSVQDYNNVVTMMDQDPGLRQKVLEKANGQ